jgi:hypothetical protein
MNTYTFYFDEIEDIVTIGRYTRDDFYNYFEIILSQNDQIEIKQTKAVPELPPIVVFQNLTDFQKWRNDRIKRQQAIIEQIKKSKSNEID